jgi:uncharacterized membrane protein
MSRYEALTFLHIGAVIVWLGAGVLLAVLIFAAERAGDRMKEAGYHQDVAWLAPRLFVPASLATLVFGVLAAVEGPWGLDELWIVIGFAGWAASFLLGFFYFRTEGERIGALVQQHGPAHPEVERRIHRLNVVDRVQVLVLFLVVASMTIKPTDDDGGVLVAGLAILALGVFLAAAAIARRGAADTAGASKAG